LFLYIKIKLISLNTFNTQFLFQNELIYKRFETEFEKLGKIGNGGFSSVYKVRNLIDNSLYAIKKLKIKIKNKNKDFENKILKVFQEIRFLAKIKAEHIVDYNHSWVEVNLKNNKGMEIQRANSNILTEKDLDFKINFNSEEDELEYMNDFHEAAENSQKFQKCKNKKDKNSDMKKLFYDDNTNNTNSNQYPNSNNKENTNFFLNLYPENINLEQNSLSNNETSRGCTMTDSSENSAESESENPSFDQNTDKVNSSKDLYMFRDNKDQIKSKKELFDYSDSEGSFNNNNNNNNNKKKKYKKLSLNNLPALFEKENRKKALGSRKRSTICIKNKEYLYEAFFSRLRIKFIA